MFKKFRLKIVKYAHIKKEHEKNVKLGKTDVNSKS